MERFDFVFSYWVFAWYILYASGLTSFNPVLMLAIGLMFNTGQLLLGLVKNPTQFIIINLFIKIIPLLMLRKTIPTHTDVYASIVYLILYSLWMAINHQNVLKTRTPLTNLLSKVSICHPKMKQDK